MRVFLISALVILTVVVLLFFVLEVEHSYNVSSTSLSSNIINSTSDSFDTFNSIGTYSSTTMPEWIPIAQSTQPIPKMDFTNNDPDGCGSYWIATSTGTIYYAGIEIKAADPESFEFLPSSSCTSYGRDKYHVYLGDEGQKYTIITGADPETFQPFYDVNGIIRYAKDKQHVYIDFDEFNLDDAIDDSVNIKTLNGADPTTFQPIYDANGYFTGYAKDSGNVWIYDIPIGADPKTFTVTAGDYIEYEGTKEVSNSGLISGRDATHSYVESKEVN